MRKIFLLGLLFSFYLRPAFSFSISNFDSPESFVVDPEDGYYYVSNVSGDSLARDGNGFISKISPNGNTVIQKFIGDKKDELLLNAPKGLTIVGKNIFVADIDTVKGFDKETGKPAAIVDLSGQKAKFLNDLTADKNGLLYVSDMTTDRIFKIEPGENYRVSIFKQGKELGNPNGVIVNPHSKNLIVVTWETGEVLEIDHMGKVHVLKKGLTRLDGVDFDKEGNLYVSSFEKGEVYKITHFGRGTLTTFLSGLKTPADISCDRQKEELLIPSYKGNTVSTVLLSKK